MGNKKIFLQCIFMYTIYTHTLTCSHIHTHTHVLFAVLLSLHLVTF